ncbi:MAG: PqqD family protein [Anaerolineae bacterium]|nr:PqqD family protein [Anaerolineae bacterium]
MSTLSDRVILSEDVLFQDVAGEAVLLNLHTGQYYGLDEIGTYVWSALNENMTMDQILAALLTEYDVAEDELQRDLLALIDALCAHELVSIIPG